MCSDFLTCMCFEAQKPVVGMKTENSSNVLKFLAKLKFSCL